jgi:hypothetical protein
MNDLGLDSLDHVEVIMAIEDEFGMFRKPLESALVIEKEGKYGLCNNHSCFCVKIRIRNP